MHFQHILSFQLVNKKYDADGEQFKYHLQEVFTVIELPPDKVYSLRNYSTETFPVSFEQ
ncbi:Uncharacterised protein [Escherichia coli]|nr:Uncharacterised protein [Escherichia coli]